MSRLIHSILSATAVGDAALRDRAFVHVGTREELLEKTQRRLEIDKLLQPIDVAVKRYVFHPRLMFLMSGRRRWWLDLTGDPVAGDYKLTRADGRRIYEGDAVFGVLRLASYGFLERVRQCLTCQKWIYAHPSHKKYCDLACQLKYFASTPRQKEKRAEYMRRYRVDQKQRTERAQRLASRQCATRVGLYARVSTLNNQYPGNRNSPNFYESRPALAWRRKLG